MVLSHVRAVVCLDSFSIHAAYAIGVPSIMLNGHLAELVLPPGSELVDGGLGLCAVYELADPRRFGRAISMHPAY